MKISHIRFWALAAALLLSMPLATQAQFSFGGYNFPSAAAFADRGAAVGSSLILQNTGPSVSAAVSDINLGTWVVAGGYYDMVDLYFDNNVIVNDAGADFVVFEYGNYPESYKVAVSGNGTPGGLGAFLQYSGTRAIDLSDFGIAAGGTVNLLRFQLNLMGGSAEGSADLQDVGALHSGDVPSVADAFTFDDGTTQGWTLVGAYDESYATLFPNSFINGWKDQVHFPHPPGGDATGDLNGCLQCFTINGHGITNPGHTWWAMEFHSPDLSALPAWQSAKGYTVELAECMVSLGILYENLFVQVYDIDQARDRDFYNGTAKEMQHDIYGDGTAVWNHDSFDWTAIANFPSRYVIKKIYVRLLGRMNAALSGGVYLDNVVPILGAMPQVPAPPTNLQVYTIPEQLHITWQDNATDEDGFVLDRKDSQLFSTWQALDTLIANCISYQMDNPVLNRSYEFRVRAFNENGFSDYSNVDTIKVFLSLSTLRITSPAGGESWNPGSVHNITWTNGTIGKPTQVIIDHSLDGGSRWLSPAIATTANTESYAWTIPNTPSTECILRIRDAADGSPYDLSNHPFTITTQTVPALSVTPLQLDFSTAYNLLSFEIRNTGGGVLTWSVAENPNKPWLVSLDPGAGSGDDTVKVTVNRALLTSAKDSTMVDITSNGGSAHVKVLIQQAAGTLPATWDFADNTGQNAIIVLPLEANPNIDGVPILYGDIIGAFTPAGLCCGWRQWQGAHLPITAWGDNDQTPAVDGFKAGESVFFRLYRLSSGKEWKNIQTAYSQGSGQYSANAFMVLSQFLAREQETMDLVLTNGWNMLSAHVDPEQPAMSNVMAPLGAKLVLIKNGRGQTFIPAYQINDIGNFNYRDGYQAYLNAAATLAVTGQPVAPDTPVNLVSGWNLTSYLPAIPINAADALNSIVSKLVLAKNGAGKTYIPQYGINDIGVLQPGQGYQFYMNAAGTLIYPASAQTSLAMRSFATPRINDSLHYHFSSNTGENATIVLPLAAQPHYLSGTPLAAGDEIAIFNQAGVCGGSALWQTENLAITVWGDDAMTDSLDGLTPGDTLCFRVWDHLHAMEYGARVSFLPGHPVVYAPNGFSVIKSLRADQLTRIIENQPAVPSSFVVAGNYPNPFNAVSKIAFQLPAPGQVTLLIYDSRGEEVWRRSLQTMAAGDHIWRWDGTNRQGQSAASGLYFFKIVYRGRTNGVEQKTGKMVLMR